MVTVNLEFKGIDYFNRPVFKDVESNNYYGSTHKLFGWEDSAEKVIEYFRSNIDELEYFGTRFGCEPYGGMSKNIIFNIVTKPSSHGNSKQ